MNLFQIIFNTMLKMTFREFLDSNYLESLSFSKAKQIYGEPLPDDVAERMKFELQIIKQRGFSGYFLFLQEVVSTAQSEFGVWVGPGRGSAAGSLVCYCLGITKIDPFKHGLLFERFLNPEGSVLPDIDIDFDDEGRGRVVEWIHQKYGKDRSAYVDSFCKNISTTAVSGAGGVNQTPSLDSAIQYGHETLSRMKAICALVKTRTGRDFDIENIPDDDAKTMELFQTGQTDDVFQFGSKGMQKCLRDLHPSCFEDLVILNCMYRPGPMDYITTLVRKKNSKKAVRYIIPCMEKCLHNTYGIIVYQEQIMMLSRLIADFSRSDSDLLRKAFERRKMDVLSVLKPRFMEGGIKNGHKRDALEKVWDEMERKGMYAFQKSHAVCYTWMSYQMAYLKANYPEEFREIMRF